MNSNKPNFVIRYRWLIIVATLVTVIVSSIWMFKLQINPDLESYLPENMPSRQQSYMIEEVFGIEEPLLIVMQGDDVLQTSSLERLQDITEVFEYDDRFSHVFSLFQAKNIRGEDGMMLVDPVVEWLPYSDEEREELREDIKNNKMAYGLLVSEDFTTALILLSSNKTTDDDELMTFILETIDDCPGPENVYVTGQPYLRDDANTKIARDLVVILPIGVLLIFIMLLISFRELKAVILPFSVVLFSILVSVGLVPLFGWEFSLLGVLIPVMMIAVANNYGVYYIARYQDLNTSDSDITMHEIVNESVKYLTKPIVFCGLTTIVGVMGLITHILLPARQMGVVSAIGIAFALLVSLFFIPAVMSFMKKGKPIKRSNGESRDVFNPLVQWVGNLVTTHPKAVISSFVLIFVLATLGLIHFKVAPDMNIVMPKDHSFNLAIDVIDEEFGGSKMLNVMFEGDAKEPELMHKLYQCEQELKELSNVGSVASLATIVMEISKALNDSNSVEFGVIPDNREAIAQYLELYMMSSDPEEVERFVDFNYDHTLLTVQFSAESIEEIDAVTDKIAEIITKDSDFNYEIAGYPLIEKEISQSVMRGQNYSLIFAFFAIIILLTIIFRSFVAGLIGSLPLVFAVFCTFGMMGWLGLELNIVTALLSSISIGLGVDFTIHVFWRIKWELESGNNYIDSIKNTLSTIGRGITINAFSVMIGFSVVFLSAFPIIHAFGLLIILSLFLCLISALMFIPAILLLIRPKFLEQNNNEK